MNIYESIYKVLYDLCVRYYETINEIMGECRMVHTDACTLMHASENLCEACIDDVFLEPYLAMLLVDFLRVVYR